MLSRDLIRSAYVEACRGEIEALKPGNVHRFADGHGMTTGQFLESARVSANPLTDPELPVGRRMLEAVRATREAVGANTNLGIILLCAPLARAAEIDGVEQRPALASVLRGLDDGDARAVFEAIVLASPGGLGAAERHDVRRPPTAPLLDAMRAAADRDRIARQYVCDFEDVFDTGMAALDRAEARGESENWRTALTYLTFLARFPDSHVVRKHGVAVAAELMREAEGVSAAAAVAGESHRIAMLLEFDRRLKENGVNPGTSADLTVASLFARRLRYSLHNRNVGD